MACSFGTFWNSTRWEVARCSFLLRKKDWRDRKGCGVWFAKVAGRWEAFSIRRVGEGKLHTTSTIYSPVPGGVSIHGGE